jgi:hypothetical protein
VVILVINLRTSTMSMPMMFFDIAGAYNSRLRDFQASKDRGAIGRGLSTVSMFVAILVSQKSSPLRLGVF